MAEKDAYSELTEATPEELLEAVMWFYQDYTAHKWLLHLGFELAQPGGWKHVAPYWLRASKELDKSSDKDD